MYFKTPEILNLLNYIKLQHPMHCEIIDQYIPRFKDIDLSRDIFSLERKELYDHPLTLATNEIVHITWDIDSIIKHAAQHRTEIPFSTVSPLNLLHDPRFDFNSSQFAETYSNVKRCITENFVHKTDYIIVCTLVCFPGYSIIDGNHRFCHALITGEKKIKILFINPKIVQLFLQPNSLQFISLLDELCSRLL